MKTWQITALSTAIFALSFATGASAQIVDGGFETPALGSSNFYAPGQSFGGPNGNAWTVTPPNGGSNVGVTISSYYNPNSGNQWLDLTGNNDNGARVGVVQSVTTVAGQAYTLTFFVGHKIDEAAPAVIGVSINGGTFTNFTNGDTTAPATGINNFKQFTYDFTATGASTSLQFVNAAGVVGSQVSGLDDVSLRAVPGPIAGAGIPALLALGGALFVRRRKTA